MFHQAGDTPLLQKLKFMVIYHIHQSFLYQSYGEICEENKCCHIYNTTCICPYISIKVSAINLRGPLLAAVRISFYLCSYNV